MITGTLQAYGAVSLYRSNGGTPTDLVNWDGSFTAGAGAVTLVGVNGVAATNPGTTLTLTGGNGNTSGAGGLVALNGGVGGATGAGGAVNLTAGAGGATSGNGGAVSLLAGAAVSGVGGLASVTAGAGGGANAGGLARLVAGAGGLTGAGGAASVTAGNGGATSGAGGAASLSAGSAVGGGLGGNVDITAGAGIGANKGGNVTLTSGVAGATDSGGDVNLIASDGGATSGNGGSIYLQPGTFTSGAAGAIILIPAGGGTAPELRFQEDDASGANYISLKAAASMAANTPYTLPDAYPALSGYVLSSTTAGVMSWTAASAGTVTGTGTTNVVPTWLTSTSLQDSTVDAGTVLLGSGPGAGAGAGNIINITPGAGGATGAGGQLNLNGGTGGATSGNGGAVAILAGSATSGLGGAASVTGGAGGGANAGGAVSLSGGTAGATGAGGSVNLTAAAGGATSGNGGSVLITVGGQTSGTQGVVTLVAPASGTAPELQFREDAANGANFFSLKAAASMATNNPYTWPAAYPAANGYQLSSTTAGVLSWAVSAGVSRFPFTLTEAGSDNFTVNHAFGLTGNFTVSMTLQDNNTLQVIPDSVTFTDGNNIVINLASYRAANGGTLPAGFVGLILG